MTNLGLTHWDPVEGESICHEECAIETIKRQREEIENLNRRVNSVVVSAGAEIAKLREIIRQKDENAKSSGLLFDDIMRLRDEAEAERDALKVDAERYRWMKANVRRIPSGWEMVGWDAAIDAAKKQR